MTWTVTVSTRARKQIERLPEQAKRSLVTLIKDIECAGPVRGNWPNYGQLDRMRHHCHIKKGRPTFVAVWQVKEREIKIIEVIYVGTHEKAPY
jgi:hypothetical protein